MLVDLFKRIQLFLKRLGVHTRITPTKEMVEILVNAMVEVLSILAIATKEAQQSQPSKSYLCTSSNREILTLTRSLSEETVWKDGYRRRFQEVGRPDPSRGSDGNC